MKHADLHMHSLCSDGTDTPAALLEKVRKANLSFFALTDHDSMDGAKELAGIAEKTDGWIPGAEFSCRVGEQKCHILGLGLEVTSPELADFFAMLSEARKNKLKKRLAYLADTFGIVFSEEEQKSLFALRVAGKPHIAALLVKRGLAPTLADAIRTYLSSGAPDQRVPAREAMEAIHRAGGVAIWAHPFGGEGETLLTHEKYARCRDLLIQDGLDGLECFYSRYDNARCSFLEADAKRLSLMVSGGSDYHGGNKNIPLGRLTSEDEPISTVRLTVLDAVCRR